jgi:formylglycine-generating enzyme required for sulfatase activity
VDLSAGSTATSYPVEYRGTAPPDLATNDGYRTTKLLLRRIAAGEFTMGSPAGELGRDDNETRHTVALTQDLFIGVFEVTQRQWTLVSGTDPSNFRGNNKRPVEQLSWNDVRGGTWPGGAPAGDTFMGRLRQRTGLSFDLPTEAQWEYACRAGTTTALNSGRDLTSTEQDSEMDKVGRYWFNGGSNYQADPVNGAHTGVGLYAPNAWGLYDLHGNVWEWCLDWYQTDLGTARVGDPVGPTSGSRRVLRGGAWSYGARYCRSADRYWYTPANRSSDIGFRLALPAGQE